MSSEVVQVVEKNKVEETPGVDAGVTNVVEKTPTAESDASAGANADTEGGTDADAAAAAKASPGDDKKDGAAAENANSGGGGITKEIAAHKPNVHKANFEKDVIYLYQFSRTPLLPSISPYCLKVETWLRLAELKYEVNFVWETTLNPHQDTKK